MEHSRLYEVKIEQLEKELKENPNLFKNITPSKLDISHLPSGIYFIRLKVNNQIVNHKILLQ